MTPLEGLVRADYAALLSGTLRARGNPQRFGHFPHEAVLQREDVVERPSTLIVRAASPVETSSSDAVTRTAEPARWKLPVSIQRAPSSRPARIHSASAASPVRCSSVRTTP